ncbi:hypothetical protein [Actinoallomurus iriomotensis]|uniref:Uncharacterized protein n=1 Tax=Actinoallomurus iriomotensis TaxID=478107 RepID=A0A9W6RE32_9ACTN|nr:hypothetical protein [Actinoallomurus iriomotensis]GLY74149.1 hypothetical protein Airi01_024160 [Actinoallomurus iriomotensis]
MIERLYGPARGWVVASWACSAVFFVLLAYDVFSGRLLAPPRWLIAAMAVTLIAGAGTQSVALRRERRRRSRTS